MNCPLCGGKTKVIDTAADCESVYRKRKCLECKYNFTTTENESNDKHMIGRLRSQQRMNKNVTR